MISDRDALVISIAGEITWQNAPLLRERLMHLIQKGHRSLILNMESVTYADSSGLSVFVSLSRTLHSMGGNLLLINTSEPLVRALRQTRLCDFIPVVPHDVTRHDRITLPPDETPEHVRTIRVPSDPSSLSKTRHIVSEMLAGLHLSRSTTYDLVLTLGEALGNAFDHGGGTTVEDSVTVTVAIYHDRVVMEVNDRGEGCNFTEGDPLPTPTETRGRGIRLMLMLADSVEIKQRSEGGGTCVRIIKMISAQQGIRGVRITADSSGTQDIRPESSNPE